MKEFNVTGLCIPQKHYMVDVSDKVAQIRKLVDDARYFTIDRARQFGKTTILASLGRSLADDYIVASISFENMSGEIFLNEKSFCAEFMELIQEAVQSVQGNDSTYNWIDKNVSTLSALRRHIIRMCTGKKVVLIIDEVDQASNNQVFLDFLSILRSNFLARESSGRHTFHSVILAGVYDIKSIKLNCKKNTNNY